MYRCCAGLDVHKEMVAAGVRRVDASGRVTKEVHTFGTTTGALLELPNWWTAQGVEAAAMESTGVFWKPIWNIQEGTLKVILVNARHVKNVPGRKTDVKDCDWITASVINRSWPAISLIHDRSTAPASCPLQIQPTAAFSPGPRCLHVVVPPPWRFSVCGSVPWPQFLEPAF